MGETAISWALLHPLHACMYMHVCHSCVFDYMTSSYYSKTAGSVIRPVLRIQGHRGKCVTFGSQFLGVQCSWTQIMQHSVEPRMFWSFGQPKTCQGGFLEKRGCTIGNMVMLLEGLATAKKRAC